MAQTAVGSVFLNFRAGVASFNNDLRQIKKVLDTTARDMEKAGKSLSVALTAPIVAAGVGMLKAADNFQKAQRTIAVGTGATGKVLQGLKKDFEDVARTVPNALGDTATAITEVFRRSGQSGEAGKELAKTFLNLSEATGTELNGNLRNGLQLFQSWGVAQEDQIETINMFARASQASGVNVTELMDAVKGADDVLQPYGVSLEQATTWMSAFEGAATDQGVVLVGLQKAMAKFVDAGVTDLPAALAQSIDEIRNAKTNTEGLSMAMDVFGKKAGPEMFDAIKGGQVDLKKLNEEIVHGTGNVKQMAEQNRTFFGQLAVLANDLNLSLGNVGQVFADALMQLKPAIEDTIRIVGDLVKWFASLPQSVQTATFVTLAFAAALGPLLVWVAKFLSFGGQLVGWLRTFLTFLAGTTKEVGFFEKAWTGIVKVFEFFVNVGSRVSGVFSQFVGWVTSGGAAATLMGTALSILSGIFIGLTAAAAAAGGDIKLFLSGFVELFWDAVSKVQDLWGQFTEYLSSVWTSFTNWFVQSINVLVSALDTWLKGFGVDVPAIWRATVQYISGVWDRFVGWFAEKIDALTKKWDTWMSELRAGIWGLGKILDNDAWQKWAVESEQAARKAKAGIEENKLVLSETVPVVNELAKAGTEAGKSVQEMGKAHDKAGAAGKRNLSLVNDLLHGTEESAKKAKDAVQNLWESLADKKAQQGIDALKEGFEKLTTAGQIIPDSSLQELEDKLTEQYRQSAIKGGAAASEELDKAARANAKNDIDVYKKEVADKKLELDKQNHQKSVDFWKGLMEDAISGTRFDWVEQFKKAAVEIASEWLTRLIEANALGADSFGSFFDIVFKTLGDAIGEWTGSITKLFGGVATDAATSAATSTATSAASSTAGAATGTAAAAGGKTIFGYSMATVAGWAAVAATAYLVGTNTLDKASKWSTNSNEQNAKNVVTTGIDAFFPGIGTAIDKALDYFGIGFGKALTKNQASLKGFESWVEETLKKSFGVALNFAVGDINQFDKNGWADQFWKDFGDKGGDTFSALGTAFEKLMGLEPGVGGQIGALLAQNLAGANGTESLDNIKLFLDSIGASTQDLTNALLDMANAGQITWFEFESMRQSLEKIPTEGLAAFGDMAGAFQQVLESGGAGKDAIIALKNVAIEAGEAGVTSFDQLRTYLLNAGYAAQEVDALIQALSQRGIASFEDLKNASDPALGGVIADMQTLGVKWDDFTGATETLDNSVKNLADSIRELSSAIKDIPEEVTTNINTNYNTSGDNPSGAARGGVLAFARGGIVRRPTLFPTTAGLGLMGENGPEAILPLTKVNGKLGVGAAGLGGGSSLVIQIDATGAQAGVEHRIMGVLQTMRESILQDAIEISAYQRSRE